MSSARPCAGALWNGPVNRVGNEMSAMDRAVLRLATVQAEDTARQIAAGYEIGERVV